jgi:hypothetical protein
VARREDVAYATATAMSLAVLALLGPLGRRIELIGEDDLSRIWAGPRAIVTGHDPYDGATWTSTAVALGTQLPDTAVYIYPPWVAVPLTPLGFLPLAPLSIAWLVIGLALAIVALRTALRELLPGRAADHAAAALMLLLSWCCVLNLVIGQWGNVLVAALLTAILALRHGHTTVAGLAALAMIVKPQLFVFTAPALAAHALWPRGDGRPPHDGVRAAAIAIAGGITLLVIGWLVLPSWWPTWAQTVGIQQTRPFADSLPALAVTLLGPNGVFLAALALFALVAIGLAFDPRSDAWLPVWTALSIAGAPYVNSYDQMLLIVPIVLAAGTLHGRAPRRSRAVLWAGAGVLLIGTPVLYRIALLRHSETLGVIVSLAVFAIVTGSLWRYRRDPARLPA